MLSGVILLISLCLINLLDTPALNHFRAFNNNGPVQGLTAMACVAFLFKFAFGVYISKMEDQTLPASAKNKKYSSKGLSGDVGKVLAAVELPV